MFKSRRKDGAMRISYASFIPMSKNRQGFPPDGPAVYVPGEMFECHAAGISPGERYFKVAYRLGCEM